MSSLTPSLLVLESTEIVRTKFIPKECEILIKENESVKANQAIFKTVVLGKLSVLRISENLDTGLQVSEGENIEKSQVVFQNKFFFGLFNNTIVSPVTGIIEKIDKKNGFIYFREPSRENIIKGFISGTVSSITDKQIDIKTSGALIQGVIGFGGETSGELICYDPAISDYANKVVVFNSHIENKDLLAVVSQNPAGLILPSIEEAQLTQLGLDQYSLAITGNEQIPYSLIITEGFGQLPMPEKTFKIFKEHQGMSCSINGKTQIRAGAVRPEVIIPNEKNTVKLNVLDLKIGNKVRLTRYPYFGKIGTITDLPIELQELASGIKTRVACIDNEIIVPRSNMELIE